MMVISSETPRSDQRTASSYGASSRSHRTDNATADDAELIVALLSGDRAAAERFAILYAAFIRTAVLSSSYAARRFEADLVQDVYVHLWRNDFHVLRQWEGPHSLRAYLRTVIKHLVWERLNGLQPLHEQLEDDPMAASGRACETADPPSTPEECVLADEVSSAVRSAIDALKPSYREVLQLRYFRELSYAEIAGAVGITPTNAGVRLKRALASMKNALCKRVHASGLFDLDPLSRRRLSVRRNKADGISLFGSQEGGKAA